MASVCCSIEMEPKTLNQGQLNLAREVAAGVVQEMEPSDASTIFTEGLREVISAKEMKKLNEDAAKIAEIVEFEEKRVEIITEIPCQCACNVSITESPDQVNFIIKEPLSAPF